MSLLCDPKMMSKDKIIKDHDIFTGKFGNNVWDPTTIHHKDSIYIPVPLDLNIKAPNIT
jgi:hypothetical protein